MKQLTSRNAFAALLMMVLMTGNAAARDVERSVDASSDGKVTITNTAGSIEVRGWSRNQVEVVADLGSGVEELEVERDGDIVSVAVKVPRNHRHSRGISSDLVLRVPENSSLSVHGVSADITVKDVHGVLRLKTVSGDVETDTFGADAEIESVSGDIEIQGDGSNMRLKASTVSGDIDAVGISGEIEASSVSGDLVIVARSYSRATMNTTNGDMVLHGALENGGRLDIETINGDLDLEFDGKPSARFEIETFNGSIRNCFGPESRRTSRYAPGRELVFTEGGGSARVSVRTLNGDIDMCTD